MTILTRGAAATATRHAYDAEAPSGKKLVLKTQVDDDAVRQQADGFDGTERAFALLPRETAGGITWERKDLHWQGALDGRNDHHWLAVDSSSVDEAAVARHGVAFGLDTNVGTLWLQRGDANVIPGGSYANILNGIGPVPKAEEKTNLFLGRGDDHFFQGVSKGVLAGKPLKVNYDRHASREMGAGERIKDITMHARLDDGTVLSQKKDVPLGRTDAYGTDFEIDIPSRAKGVEVWYEATGESGQQYFDSRGGRNFKYDVIPEPTSVLRFDENWNEAQSAPLRAGESFEIGYDVDRLKNFLGDGWYRMGPTFSAYAEVSFDGGPAKQIPLTNWTYDRGNNGSHTNYQLEVRKPRVKIPENARSMEVWFRGYVISRQQFDSNLGGNYKFDVEPRG
jgi:hypothetical protein